MTTEFDINDAIIADAAANGLADPEALINEDGQGDALAFEEERQVVEGESGPGEGDRGPQAEQEAPVVPARKPVAAPRRGMRVLPASPSDQNDGPDPFAPKPAKPEPMEDDDDLAAYLGADRFPIEALPPNIRRIITEIADNKRAHPEMIFMHLLALVSACIGSRRTLCPHADYHATWREPAIFWGMIIASSGETKSPSMKLIFRALRKMQKAEESSYEKAFGDYEQYMKKWEEEEHDPGDEPNMTAPLKKQYAVDDTTLEAIHAILMHNPYGIMWLKDEIRSLIKNLNKYNNGDGTDVLLSFWSGFAWTKNRSSMKKRGAQASDTVDDAMVGIYGGIQPGAFEKFFTKDDVFSGLAQRFLFCVLKEPRKKTLKVPPISPATLDELECITRRMIAIPEIDRPLYLSAEAFEIYNDYYETIGNAEPRSFLMKATNNTLRLALMLHYLNGQGDGEIEAWEIEAAITIMKWFIVTLFRRVLPLLEAQPSKSAEILAVDQAREAYITDFLQQHPVTRATSAALMKMFGEGHPFENKAGKPSANILGKALTAMGYQQDRSTGDRAYDLTKRTGEPMKKQGIVTPAGKVIFDAADDDNADY